MGLVASAFGNAVRILAILFIAWSAYDIRMHAIRGYGRVIHEVSAPARQRPPAARALKVPTDRGASV